MTSSPIETVFKVAVHGETRPYKYIHTSLSDAWGKEKLILVYSSYKERACEDSQSRQMVTYGCESRGIRQQESLCWRGPAEIYQAISHSNTNVDL
jgi:urease accessory protein UreF